MECPRRRASSSCTDRPGHTFSACARESCARSWWTMRAHRYQKRGGDCHIEPLDEAATCPPVPTEKSVLVGPLKLRRPMDTPLRDDVGASALSAPTALTQKRARNRPPQSGGRYRLSDISTHCQ